MADSENSPLLPADEQAKSAAELSETSVESTPLLSGADATPRYDGENDGASLADGDVSAASSSRRTPRTPSVRSAKKGRRWPSIIAMIVLALLSVVIMVIAFFVPATVEEYAKAAAVVEPTNLSLESITTNGVRVRIQANFRVDGQRVGNDHIRRVGRFATWMVGELRTGETTVAVRLPEHEGVLLGTASVPPLHINIADGHSTALDFVTELAPGSAEGIRTVANEFLRGELHRLRVQARASVRVQSGIVPLGTHSIVESLVLEGKKIPQLPEHNITKLSFRERTIPGSGRKVMAAEASISAFNQYPVSLDVPALEFEILVSGCGPNDSYIVVAEAANSPIAVRPESTVQADVRGLVMDIPDSLTSVCPESELSPLDLFLKSYLAGKTATVFVRGKKQAKAETPDWLTDMLSSVTVPVPFPGRSFNGMIRNFSMTDVHFTMPDPTVEPGKPGSEPKVSGNIQVIAAIPSEMQLDLNVTNVRATADVLYKSNKLGELNLRRWQEANSTRLNTTQGNEAAIQIQSRIIEAPVNVTDPDVLTDVIQTLLFGAKMVILDIKALVDVKVQTVLGPLVLKDVPAGGKIPVKPLPIDTIGGGLKPKIGSIDIIDTTPSSVTLQARVNVTNPTPYTARIPAINIHIFCNDTQVGEAMAEDLDIVAGRNTNLLVRARWNPSQAGGERGSQIGRDFISQYLSGYNTSVSLRAHRDSIPTQPLIGEALSRFNFTVSTPRPSLPGGGGDGEDGDSSERTRFIRDATFHVFSSTATFTLVSPLQHNTLFIDRINATAFYNHTEPVGHIVYEFPFAAPPGASQTPRLPVDWSLDSVGYDKLRRALGGSLKLDAFAVVDVRLGTWKETVWYVGRGIGAGIKM